jgi:hypothetical protein
MLMKLTLKLNIKKSITRGNNLNDGNVLGEARLASGSSIIRIEQ